MIKGKKVLVTGGAQGLGLALVRSFYRAGAEIAVIDIRDQVFQLSQSIGAEDDKIHPIKGDLSVMESLRHSFNKAIEELGGHIDILINCAGLIQRESAFHFSMESWNRILDVNVTAVFELSRLAAVKMKKQRSGKIINFASILSVIGGYHAAAYSTSKGAIKQLTKSLSNEWAEYGIQVNAIAPGYMLTTMNTDLMKDSVRSTQVAERIPAKRWGTPEDVAGVALFLASPASNYVTGTIIPVDGGVLGR
ncbi:SDR family oxidoreductase [Sporolactobacillus sp. Y61]|uniref:SDR family oxidoreductase n=1 Tax=Sporolactobacillus sp. Y61 TaxID=3160863 RepID=A0AAU8IKE8_9BACL